MEPRSGRHRHADVLSQAGIEGLLAGIPTAVVLSIKNCVHADIDKTLQGVLSKGENAAGDAVHGTVGKFRMNASVTVAAVIIGAAVLHGAWRGYEKHRQRTFAEREEQRRAAAAAKDERSR